MSEFTGDVSLNNHKISLLSDPVSDSDAVNKSYFLNKINSIREFNNDISMRGNSITNLKNPVAPADDFTKEYVDTCIAAQAAQKKFRKHWLILLTKFIYPTSAI